MFLKRINEDHIHVHHRNGIKWNNNVFNLMWTKRVGTRLILGGRVTTVVVVGQTGEDEETLPKIG